MGNAIRMMNAHHDPAFDDDGGEGSDFQNARLAVGPRCDPCMLPLMND